MAIFKPHIKIFPLLPLLIVVAIAACDNTNPIVNHPHDIEDAPASSQAWNYGQLTNTIRNAKVIAHVKNGMSCGRATCSSVSIIEVNKTDTIRVLELSSMHQDFEEGSKVNIKPGRKPMSLVSLPVIAAYDCKNYKTYYGTVISAN